MQKFINTSYADLSTTACTCCSRYRACHRAQEETRNDTRMQKDM